MIYTVELFSTSTFQKYIHFPKTDAALRELSLLDFKPGGCDNFNSFHTKYTNRVNKPEEKRSSINSVKLNTFGKY